MATSQNGWAARKDLKTRVITPVRGVSLRIVDNDDVAEVFTYLVKNFHKRVDRVDAPHDQDDWGFYFRPNVNNPNELSNHASGTAIDLDATEHPNGVPTGRTFTVEQISEVHQILRELDGVVRWGGDYNHTVDAMHFEINGTPTQVRKVADKLRGKIVDKIVEAPRPIPPKPSAPRRKTTLQVAREVVDGKWGNGNERRKRLTAAGYSYREVQAKVNQLLQ
jgi:hypothetical protein